MEAIRKNWADVVEVLKLKIEASDFSFLGVLGLSPKQSEVMKIAISAAVLTPTDFPVVPNLNRLMASQGLSTGNASHLQKKGYLKHLDKNSWRLTSLFFERTGLGSVEGESLEGIKEASEPLPAKRRRFKHGSKAENFLKLLRSEMISGELQLTPELARNWARSLNAKNSYIRGMLWRLTKRGILEVRRLDKGHGFLIEFGRAESGIPVEEETKRKEISISDLIKRSEEIIKNLGLKIEALQRKIQAEVAFLEQLKKRV